MAATLTSFLPSDSSPSSKASEPQARRMLSKHKALSQTPLGAIPNVGWACCILCAFVQAPAGGRGVAGPLLSCCGKAFATSVWVVEYLATWSVERY